MSEFVGGCVRTGQAVLGATKTLCRHLISRYGHLQIEVTTVAEVHVMSTRLTWSGMQG